MRIIRSILCLSLGLLATCIHVPNHGQFDDPKFNLMLAVQTVEAETIPGYDVLGVAMYCGRFLEAPPLPAVSTLMNTFGNPLPCIEQRIQRGGLKLVQVDLIDATCWRNRVCPPGVPRPDDHKEVQRRARQVFQLAQKYPSVEFWLSPTLEHDIKDAAVVKRNLEAAKKGCPICKVINSAAGGAKPPGYPNEQHGTKVRDFSVSSDGASIFDGDNLRYDGNKFEHRVAGSYSTFGWFPELNLRCSGESKFTMPLKRTNKPTADLFAQCHAIMQPEPTRPAPPAQCKRVRDFVPGKEINKPNAEAYCNGDHDDGRGNKGLLIIRKPGKRGDRLNILRSDGRVAGCYGYFATYDPMPGTHRWYVGVCSRQTPIALRDALGSEWGYVELGGGECLAVNVLRRQGVYR